MAVTCHLCGNDVGTITRRCYACGVVAIRDDEAIDLACYDAPAIAGSCALCGEAPCICQDAERWLAGLKAKRPCHAIA